MHYTRAYVDRAASEADGLLRFVAATEGVKGDGIDLRMSGAKLERYRANPIFGYGHKYWSREDLPIGRSEAVELVGTKLRIGVVFDQGDAFAKEVERKYRDGYMSAVSIGFDVTKWENDEGNYWRGGVAEEWVLLEVSAVPVPMDASAVVESGRSLLVPQRNGAPGLEVDPAAVASLVWDRLHAELRGLGTDSPAEPEAENSKVLRLIEEAAAGGQLDAVRQLGIDRGWWRDATPYTINMTFTDMPGPTEVAEQVQRAMSRGAIPAHKTAVTDETWDGPGAVAKCPADAKSLRAIHAWVDPEGDADAKTSYKLPHHATPGGPANLAGVRNALARLPQSNIPEGDQAAVKTHLQTHLDAQKAEDAHPGGETRAEPDTSPDDAPEPEPEQAPETAAPDDGVDTDAARSLLAAFNLEKE